ncbi:hypothetical protein EV181_006940, partial [Coemansia sp. RSA 532]
ICPSLSRTQTASSTPCTSARSTACSLGRLRTHQLTLPCGRQIRLRHVRRRRRRQQRRWTQQPICDMLLTATSQLDTTRAHMLMSRRTATMDRIATDRQDGCHFMGHRNINGQRSLGRRWPQSTRATWHSRTCGMRTQLSHSSCTHPQCRRTASRTHLRCTTGSQAATRPPIIDTQAWRRTHTSQIGEPSWCLHIGRTIYRRRRQPRARSGTTTRPDCWCSCGSSLSRSSRPTSATPA